MTLWGADAVLDRLEVHRRHLRPYWCNAVLLCFQCILNAPACSYTFDMEILQYGVAVFNIAQVLRFSHADDTKRVCLLQIY